MPLAPVKDPNLLAKLNETPVTDSALLAQLEGQPMPQAPQGDGFGERVGQRFEERQLEVADTFADFAAGKINPAELVLQTVGKGAAGGTLDVLGEAVTSAGRGLATAFPDTTESIKQGMAFMAGTDIGQQALEAINKGAEAYGSFKQENPRAAKNVESVVNTGILFAPAKVRKNAPPSPLAKTSAVIKRKAIRKQQASRKDFIDDLVSPKETPSVLLEQVPRTAEIGRGPFRRSKVTLSPQEKLSAAEVTRIPGVSNKNTIQGNYNVIASQNRRLAKDLEAKVGAEKASIPLEQLTARINAAIDDVVTKNPTVVGDAALAAKSRRVAEKAVEILSEGELTPLGILKARRGLDDWLLKNRPKVFDQAENTLSASGRAVRNVLNNTVDDLAPTASVRDSLRRQSTLFNAMENIGPKAAAEPNNAFMRLWQNTGRVIGPRNRLIQDAAILFGVGGLGAAAMFAPTLTKAGAAGLSAYGIFKGATHPKTLKGMAKILKATDEALRTTKNPSMIKQLRADRAIVVEMMQNIETDESMPLAFEEQ